MEHHLSKDCSKFNLFQVLCTSSVAIILSYYLIVRIFRIVLEHTLCTNPYYRIRSRDNNCFNWIAYTERCFQKRHRVYRDCSQTIPSEIIVRFPSTYVRQGLETWALCFPSTRLLACFCVIVRECVFAQCVFTWMRVFLVRARFRALLRWRVQCASAPVHVYAPNGEHAVFGWNPCNVFVTVQRKSEWIGVPISLKRWPSCRCDTISFSSVCA